MTLFSDGIASRLLVGNLIYQLEKQGILDSDMTNKIFESSINQAKGFLKNLDMIDDISLRDLNESAIEKAIEILQEDLNHIQTQRDV